MSYDKKYRKRTIEYREEGHSLKETSSLFKVSISTILDWTKLCEETGGYEKRPLNRSFNIMERSQESHHHHCQDAVDCHLEHSQKEQTSQHRALSSLIVHPRIVRFLLMRLST